MQRAKKNNQLYLGPVLLPMGQLIKGQGVQVKSPFVQPPRSPASDYFYTCLWPTLHLETGRAIKHLAYMLQLAAKFLPICPCLFLEYFPHLCCSLPLQLHWVPSSPSHSIITLLFFLPFVFFRPSEKHGAENSEGETSKQKSKEWRTILCIREGKTQCS